MADLKQKALDNGYSDVVIEKSEAYAKDISNQLSSWIDKDMYIETRTYPRFTSTKKPENWRETPPDYETGLEPHWDNLRTHMIDSANVFDYKPLPEFSTEKDDTLQTPRHASTAHLPLLLLYYSEYSNSFIFT